MGKKKSTISTCWMLQPPADKITPAVARHWLRWTYPGLSALAALGAYPSAFQGRGCGVRGEDRERARYGARGVAVDARRIASACGRVLATGKPVTMRFDARYDVQGTMRNVRALARYEAAVPHRGARTALKRALRVLGPMAREWVAERRKLDAGMRG